MMDYSELQLILADARVFASSKRLLEKEKERIDIDKVAIMLEIQYIKQKNDKDFYQEKIGELREKVKKYTEDNKKLEKKKNELEKKIKDKKDKVITDLKEKQEKIFKNRHEKVEKVSREERKELIKEKRRLRSEIRSEEHLNLIRTPKTKLREMSDEDKEKVNQARQKDKDNKKRIEEISKKLDMIDLFDGKKPEELFKRNKIIIENMEAKFNIDRIDEITSIDAITSKTDDKTKQQNDEKGKDSKGSKKPKEKSQQQGQQTSNNNTQVNDTQQQGQQTSNNNTQVNGMPQQEQQYNQFLGDNINNVYDIGANIAILEAEGVATFNFGENQQGWFNLKNGRAGRKEKKEMYKRLNIKKRVKGFRTLKKVNPVIIKILEKVENGDMMIDQYLQSIKSKKQFNFGLKHDLAGLGVFKRLRKNRQAKREQKCGAEVTGKLFDRSDKRIYETLQEPAVNVPRPARRRNIDSYVRADEETIHRTEQIGQRASQTIQEESQEVENEPKTQEDITI